MKFEQFAADTIIILTADDPQAERIKFSIGSQLLVDYLGVKLPVHVKDCLKLCEARREKIEAACRRAFEREPSTRVTLQDLDFEPSQPTDVAKVGA